MSSRPLPATLPTLKTTRRLMKPPKLVQLLAGTPLTLLLIALATQLLLTLMPVCLTSHLCITKMNTSSTDSSLPSTLVAATMPRFGLKTSSLLFTSMFGVLSSPSLTTTSAIMSSSMATSAMPLSGSSKLPACSSSSKLMPTNATTVSLITKTTTASGLPTTLTIHSGKWISLKTSGEVTSWTTTAVTSGTKENLLAESKKMLIFETNYTL
mmetsp:Transcript_23584/g.32123  ORF Transcript_23584/g.32123 Transcript_23584/m.32123 type:complete len:211 (+) Transcript_23584:89-721(+)